MRTPKVIFVNPSRVSTGTMESPGTAFVMPAAPVTLAGAIPAGLDVEPLVVDEAISRFDASFLRPGDIVALSVLTNNCLRAYHLIKEVKKRGATVILGGPHPTLLPEEAVRFEADAVVRGDGDTVLGKVLEDVLMKRIPSSKIYQDADDDGKPTPFRAEGHEMAYPRLDLVDTGRYCTASVRSNGGCIESCTFCTVPEIGGRVPREWPVEMVAREVRELHDRHMRIILWGADNLVQTPLSRVREARTPATRRALELERERSLNFFHKFSALTGEKRCWGFAQLTLRLHDDPEMLEAIRQHGAICAALFGIESVNPDALRRMAKGWNGTRDEIVEKVRRIQRTGIHVLGSMIVGLPTDTRETIAAMRRFSVESQMSVAQFPTFQLFPGSPDYKKAHREFIRERSPDNPLSILPEANGSSVKLLQEEHWLNPDQSVPYFQHPTLDDPTIRQEDRESWQYFYRLSHLLQNGVRNDWPLRTILTYTAGCKGFARFYGGAVGFSADSARISDTSWSQKRLMAFGAWLMHHVPSPPPLAT
jgi:radical SAM superfamily enzyme YgiQ (UPF0313 family)